MDWNEVLDKLNRAKAVFLDRDRDLLRVNANERSMTHKFAEYLQDEFDSWNVDCEYNRDGEIPKRLRGMRSIHVPPADEYAQTVFPDIVVHLRGRQGPREARNLLVIEAKKSRNTCGTDREKLAALKDEYSYEFAVRLLFVTDEPQDIEIERC